MKPKIENSVFHTSVNTKSCDNNCGTKIISGTDKPKRDGFNLISGGAHASTMVVITTKEFMEAVYKRDWSKGRAPVFRVKATRSCLSRVVSRRLDE